MQHFHNDGHINFALKNADDFYSATALMMIEFAWVSYWFPNAGTGAFCEYLNAVYIGGNKQKQHELFMKERKLNRHRKHRDNFVGWLAFERKSFHQSESQSLQIYWEKN